MASRGPDFQRTASSEWRGGRRALGSRADSYEAGPGGWNAAQRADSVARMWLPEGAVRVGRPTGPKEGWQHAASSAQSRSVRPASYYHKMPCRSGSMPPRRAGERGVGRRRRACADEQGDGCPAPQRPTRSRQALRCCRPPGPNRRPGCSRHAAHSARRRGPLPAIPTQSRWRAARLPAPDLKLRV